MKKFIAVWMSMLMILSLAGCSRQEDGSAGTEPAGESAIEDITPDAAEKADAGADDAAQEEQDAADAVREKQDAVEETGEEEPADETESGELLAEAAGTGDWLEGERFQSNASKESVQEWVDSLGL